MVMFSLLLTGCASVPSYQIFDACLQRCVIQGYRNLSKCTWLSGIKFHKCYSSQSIEELRCDQTCHFKLEGFIKE